MGGADGEKNSCHGGADGELIRRLSTAFRGVRTAVDKEPVLRYREYHPGTTTAFYAKRHTQGIRRALRVAQFPPSGTLVNSVVFYLDKGVSSSTLSFSSVYCSWNRTIRDAHRLAGDWLTEFCTRIRHAFRKTHINPFFFVITLVNISPQPGEHQPLHPGRSKKQNTHTHTLVVRGVSSSLRHRPNSNGERHRPRWCWSVGSLFCFSGAWVRESLSTGSLVAKQVYYVAVVPQRRKGGRLPFSARKARKTSAMTSIPRRKGVSPHIKSYGHPPLSPLHQYL